MRARVNSGRATCSDMRERLIWKAMSVDGQATAVKLEPVGWFRAKEQRLRVTLKSCTHEHNTLAEIWSHKCAETCCVKTKVVPHWLWKYTESQMIHLYSSDSKFLENWAFKWQVDRLTWTQYDVPVTVTKQKRLLFRLWFYFLYRFECQTCSATK